MVISRTFIANTTYRVYNMAQKVADGAEGSPEANTANSATAIKIENVTKRFDSVVAVLDASLSVQDGEFLTLLGPSGAGKSTLLHMIAGFIEPTDGDMYLNGEKATKKAPYERGLGMVFQDLALFPHMTVEENIAFSLKMRRRDPDEISEKVSSLLDLVQLPESYLSNQIEELSGGEQQRVAVARALIFNPTALLLDEPLSSLDRNLRKNMQTELMRIHRETDQTIIHVTHDQKAALKMADRIAVLNEGTIEQVSEPSELYSNPQTSFVADFIGDMNLFQGTITRQDGGSIVCDTGEIEIKLESGSEVDIDDEVVVGVKPEDISLSRADNGANNQYASEIVESAYEGDQVNYSMQIKHSSHQVHANEYNIDPDSMYKPGEDVVVSINKSDTVLFS